MKPHMCEAAKPEADEPSSALGRFRAWVGSKYKLNKADFSKLGVDFTFTYGVVSNINVGLTASVAYILFTRATGLSPFAPGQWKGYLGKYLIVYATAGTVLRPVRIMIAAGATPLYGRFVNWLSRGLPLAGSRPKLNRALAIFIGTFLLNVVGTFGVIGLCVWLASILTGVPVFPPGFELPAFVPPFLRFGASVGK
jgi:hypothetical protein